MKVIIHPEARREFDEQVDYLHSHGVLPNAAELFIDEIESALKQIQVRLRGGRFPGRENYFRAGPTKRFSYSVIYQINGETIEVLAIAAAPRRPGYWKRRRF